MRFVNLTRDTEIGANSYYLELGGRRIVLDAGLHPKREGLKGLPNFNALPTAQLDSILISHAHQDHIGSLPVLRRSCPDTPILLTTPTAALADGMLHNSVSVMFRLRTDTGLPEYPIFTHREVEETETSFRRCHCRRRYSLEGDRLEAADRESVSVEFFDAGHIMGSAGILLRDGERSLFYTGDVNLDDQSLSRGAELPEKPVDVLIMETTRGDSITPEGFSRASEEVRFRTALEEALTRGGCVLIPVFALGKTQEILTILFEMRKRGKLKEIPIYIGGLSTKITSIHDSHAHSVRRLHPGLELFEALAPYTLTAKTFSDSPVDRPRIYALSSGMMTEHTISNRFARRIVSDPRCSIFWVGYCDPLSPAWKLQNTASGELIQLDSELPAQEVRCHRDTFSFSAHAPRERLLDLATKLQPKKIVLVHGDLPAVAWFQTQLASRLPDAEVILPPPGVMITL